MNDVELKPQGEWSLFDKVRAVGVVAPIERAIQAIRSLVRQEIRVSEAMPAIEISTCSDPAPVVARITWPCGDAEGRGRDGDEAIRALLVSMLDRFKEVERRRSEAFGCVAERLGVR